MPAVCRLSSIVAISARVMARCGSSRPLLPRTMPKSTAQAMDDVAQELTFALSGKSPLIASPPSWPVDRHSTVATISRVMGLPTPKSVPVP